MMIDITKKLIPSYFDRSYCDELQFYHPDNCFYSALLQQWRLVADRMDTVGKPQFYSGILLSINNNPKKTLDEIIFSGKNGHISIEAEFYNVDGAFPAAWLLQHKGEKGKISEIDIFEWIPQDSRKIHLTHHWGSGYGTKDHKKRSIKVKGDWTGYHRYELKWNKCFMWWKVDGRLRKIIFNRYRKNNYYLLINLAIGGWAKNPLWSQNYIKMSVKNVKISKKDKNN